MVAAILTLFFLSLALASVLNYSTNAYRNSHRQTRIEEAKLVAESEMENLFYRWKTEVGRGTPSDAVASRLEDDDVVGALASTFTPLSSTIADRGWSVSRTITFLWSATGRNEDGKTGRNFYYKAQVRAFRQDPIFGLIEYRAGRRFVQSEASLFQNAVFYQGDLEMAANSNMTIGGPIVANGSIYIGAQQGRTLTITDSVSYGDMFNGSTDPLAGTTLRKPGVGGASSASTLTDPIFDSNLEDGNRPDQATARGQQVKRLQTPENFIGGIDVEQVLSDYPDAYQNSSGVPDANEVYRSVIAPPPKDSTGDPIDEDPVVAARRMYNRAGIIITIGESAGTPTISVGTAANPTAYNANIAAQLSTVIPESERRIDLYDKREGRAIKITTLDVGALATAIGNDTQLKTAFNGVVYIHDTTNNGYGNGIRIKNAATTPYYSDKGALGFSLVTNNGLYVQGNYNINNTVDGTSNSSALMADAVTLLSDNWQDSYTSSTMLGDRTAGMASGSRMTVKAAILTGNTPSSSSGNSGGVQNLVRYLENWWSGGMEVEIEGSLGQLFASKYMNSRYLGTNELTSDGDYVYFNPSIRTMRFDYKLASNPPAFTPTTTKYFRGDYFTW